MFYTQGPLFIEQSGLLLKNLFKNLFLMVLFISIDINECEPTNDCMHNCNNTVGSYSCYCNEFFVVNPNDSKACIRKFNFF